MRSNLRAQDLEKYFDEVVISGEVGYVKPDPRIFELTLQRMNIAASEAIFVDDLQYYADGAKKVGITVVRFVNADQLRADLKSLAVL